jgi:hypothetical protein
MPTVVHMQRDSTSRSAGLSLQTLSKHHVDDLVGFAVHNQEWHAK